MESTVTIPLEDYNALINKVDEINEVLIAFKKDDFIIKRSWNQYGTNYYSYYKGDEICNYIKNDKFEIEGKNKLLEKQIQTYKDMSIWEFILLKIRKRRN